mmetsp:Transcript_22309/g.71330  ORF Transcript_22309/g.71330 Transcript_22309/m.71330 type:complete len:206 (+) Transcript_22309:952-1569(+)
MVHRHGEGELDQYAEEPWAEDASEDNQRRPVQVPPEAFPRNSMLHDRVAHQHRTAAGERGRGPVHLERNDESAQPPQDEGSDEKLGGLVPRDGKHSAQPAPDLNRQLQRRERRARNICHGLRREVEVEGHRGDRQAPRDQEPDAQDERLMLEGDAEQAHGGMADEQRQRHSRHRREEARNPSKRGQRNDAKDAPLGALARRQPAA